MQTITGLKKIVKRFHGTKVLVIGDVMLDRFIWGKVGRISPEAPVPVVEVTKETFMPGGAGNVVSNISALGGQPYLIGMVGDDVNAKSFFEEMEKRNVNTDGLVTVQDRPTIVKTRIIAHQQQVVRVDREKKSVVTPGYTTKLIEQIKHMIPRVSSVIISDYGKGVISQKVLTAAISYAKKHKKSIVVDPKIEHFKRYRKVTCITPNLQEAMQGMHWLHADSQGAVEDLGKKIMKTLALDSLLITQGEKGMTIFENNNVITHIPTMAQEVFDVTGAGDTVISTLAMCAAQGVSIVDSAYISNCAAGIVVGKLGTATVSSREIIKNLR